MNKQDIYTLCTLIPSMDDYSGHNMYLLCIYAVNVTDSTSVCRR